jgi:hypothetical protein
MKKAAGVSAAVLVAGRNPKSARDAAVAANAACKLESGSWSKTRSIAFDCAKSYPGCICGGIKEPERAS